jgi:DNA-binding FadR family transcriptional regulator
MGAALGATMRLSTQLSRAYEATLHVHRDVLEAIRLRDPQAAEARMRALLDLARHDLAPVMGLTL